MSRILEQVNELNRTVEFLPDEIELGERRRRSQSLTRPELAVLLAYAKLSLHSELLDSPVPDDPYLASELARYFPAAMASTPARCCTRSLRRMSSDPVKITY